MVCGGSFHKNIGQMAQQNAQRLERALLMSSIFIVFQSRAIMDSDVSSPCVNSDCDSDMDFQPLERYLFCVLLTQNLSL